MAEPEYTIKIDETAWVDPSVILQGNITIGPWSRLRAGVVIVGDVTIGHHTTVHLNTAIRNKVIIGNHVQIYDAACIESGRPANRGNVGPEPEITVIGDCAWINHGATFHGCQIGEGAAIGLNACLDYGCKVGNGAIVANGTACPVGMVIPDNCVVEGVPAKIVETDITDEDRMRRMGLVPRDDIEVMSRIGVEFIKKAKDL